MQNKKGFVWGFYVSAALMFLMLASAVTERNPHGFYTSLRWICCAGFAYSAFTSNLINRIAWVWIFGVQAILFNPIIVFHFRRDTWQTLDKIAIASLIVAGVMFWKEAKP
ncbi:MAG: DUF6804 family protein [Verrucomicrobiota bacterium]